MHVVIHPKKRQYSLELNGTEELEEEKYQRLTRPLVEEVYAGISRRQRQKVNKSETRKRQTLIAENT